MQNHNAASFAYLISHLFLNPTFSVGDEDHEYIKLIKGGGSLCLATIFSWKPSTDAHF